jgi:thiazole synthase
LPDWLVYRNEYGCRHRKGPAIAMELGTEAVLMNPAIAEANDSEKMAKAMKLAIEAGRLAYLSGRMPKRLYASASNPVTGVVR